MERFFQRESVLLGYSPQRSLINDNSSSPKTPQRNSDVDFNDVFGGPPRRSFIHNHEMRYSFSEAMDDNGLTEGDETLVSRNSWNGRSEKPVFGEEGLSRRRYPSEKFFNDIFKGNESLSSSPRKRDWDPYASSPGSRVLSPARPLPPKAEPFANSVPAQFSLPAKLTKGMELPTFGSPPRSPYKSKDGASNDSSFYSHTRSKSSSLSQSQEEMNDTKSTYRQSLLSRELSLSCKESSKLIGYDETDRGGSSKEKSNSSEGVTNGNQFHFSIYKWATKGVPLVMPLRGGSNFRLKECDNTKKSSRFGSRIESDSMAGELSTATLHDTKLPLNDRESAAIDKFPVMEQDKQDNGSLPDTINRDKVQTWQIADSDKATSQCTEEEAKTHSLSEIGLFDESKKTISVVDEEAPKPELKSLHSLFNNFDHEQRNEEITHKASGKGSKVKSTKISSTVLDLSKNTKKQDGKKTTNDSSRAGKVSLGSPRNLGDSGKTRVRGKVKEFIKIFNQEALSKPKTSIDSQTQSYRWKEIGTSKPEKEAKFSKIGTETKTHVPNRHDKKSLSEAHVVVNEHLQCSEKQHSATKNANHVFNGTPQKKDSSVTASIPNGLKAVAGDVDETFQANFQVKELMQDENRMTQAGSNPEEIQDVDAKIRQWSNGKDGNIRSLLSTLQYVLWPGSGWKPVPLIDIIEANAVKRSYQKALLCLHPDKLQQKGAASHQKYIAEKVFDVLQDAWTHFNSLDSL